MENLVETRLALETLKRGLSTNASSKAFISIKAFISALIVKDFDKIIQNKLFRPNTRSYRSFV